MSWYGYLVKPERERSLETRQRIEALFVVAGALSTYRPRYPDRIRHIDILDAGLARRHPHQYALRLASRIFYRTSDQLGEMTILETVVFSLTLPQRPKIVTIERAKASVATQRVPTAKSAPTQASQRGDALHYQLRRFAYAWLAEMDRSPEQPPFTPDAFEQARYIIEFGATTIRGTVDSGLRQRLDQQGIGGHLLRSITVIRAPDETRALTIELIIDWKGKTPGGLSAIGKIRQEISLVLSDSDQISVTTIRETHLLPDLKPWVKLLC